jgi:hypothetical protein
MSGREEMASNFDSEIEEGPLSLVSNLGWVLSNVSIREADVG